MALLLLALSVIAPVLYHRDINVVTDVCKTPQNETDTHYMMAKKGQCWHTSALEHQSRLPKYVQYLEL